MDLSAIISAWRDHPDFRNRALGGLRALDGFAFQLFVSLDTFFDAVSKKSGVDAQMAFEGLSDVTRRDSGLYYLSQVKTTLSKEALRSAAMEFLAIDRFLASAGPELSSLRDRMRYRITTRRITSGAATDLAALAAADLGLEPALAADWGRVRQQCLPVEVAPAPVVGLAVRLWQDVTRPLALIDECSGALLRLLADRRSPNEITQSLLERWQAARRHLPSPARIVTAASLAPPDLTGEAPMSRRIVHGVRPRLEDLREGCFMPRPVVLDRVLTCIRAQFAERARVPGQPLPVFFIVGPSGAGKSALLLQSIAELVGSGDTDVIHFVDSYARQVPGALRALEGATHTAMVAGDDLFAPENRADELWDEIGALAGSLRLPPSCALLTCGPSEHLSALKRACVRHLSLVPIEIEIKPLDEAEREAYHGWYQARTGSTVPLSREPIFVAAAWTYELFREQQLTPEQFALRFDARLQELDLREPARTALALNLYGLKAPETLFRDRMAELDQLRNEQIWRLAHPGTGSLSGRFFHPQISRLIYDSLVDPESHVARAEDMARGFGAMLDEGEAADAFLGWLGGGKVGKGKRRGALLLTEEMREQILRALWACFRERGATETVTPRLLRWHRAALDAEIDLARLGAKARIHDWWRATAPDAPPWPLLFQMVWRGATEQEREPLVDIGHDWLADHVESATFSWICTPLLRCAPTNDALRALGLTWLGSNPAALGWPAVFGALVETLGSGSGSPDEERRMLFDLALAAIPVQPETDADLPVWQTTETLDPSSPIALFGAIARKLSVVRSPRKRAQGSAFLLKRIPPGWIVDLVGEALAATMNNPSWGHLWMALVAARPNERDLVALGRDWLAGREDRAEWAFVWQKLLDLTPEAGRPALLGLGRDWLAGREDRAEWSHVWQKLLDLTPEAGRPALLGLGRDWLAGREDRAEWAFVWEKLMVHDRAGRAPLAARGRAWLAANPNHPRATPVRRLLGRLG